MDKSSNNKIYRFGDFTFDIASLMLYRNGEEIALAPRPATTLLVLLENRREIISKDKLMAEVWADTVVDDSNLAQYLHQLRKILGLQTDGRPYIETFRRRGYRFNCDVSVTEKEGNGNDRIQPIVRLDDNEYKVSDQNVTQKVTEDTVHDITLESVTVRDVGEETFQKPKRSSSIKWAAIAVASVFLLAWSGVFSSTRENAKNTKNETSVVNLTDSDVGAASISPNTGYFAYATAEKDGEHLWKQQTGRSDRIDLAGPRQGHIIGSAFTPDSQFFYFIEASKDDSPGTLWRVSASGGQPTQILTGIKDAPTFSPDGSRMAFIRQAAENETTWLVTAASDGSNEQRLLPDTPESPQYVKGGAWSPDGQTIAYGVIDFRQTWEASCTIVATNVKDGSTRPLSNEKWDQCYRMAWTRDARSLVFIGSKSGDSQTLRRDQVYAISVADGSSRRITQGGNRYEWKSLGVTDNGDILAVPATFYSQIWSMDATGDSRTALQLTNDRADGGSGITPLPDGRIAFMSRQGDGRSIWIMNADGSNRKQLLADPPSMEELRASPDGSFLVFSAIRNYANHLYRVDIDGSNFQQLTTGPGHEIDSSFSPDGKALAYSSLNVTDEGVTKYSIRLIPVDGGQETIVSDINCDTPNYSPDGSRISCISVPDENIIIISANDGSVITKFAPHENAQLNFGARWTPDGKNMIYIAARDTSSNIYIQPANGGEAVPLTNFTNGKIYNFAFSADGKRLFLARGYKTQPVVLLSNAF